MSQEEIDKKIKERLQGIFPDAATAAKVVDLVTSPRPEGWSKRSNAPYYKEVYAAQVKADIDRMISNNSYILYRFAQWCSGPAAMSRNTLYSRINQSIRYLVERMDTPDKKYYNWSQQIRVRKADAGVLVTFIPGLQAGNPDNLRGEEIAPEVVNAPMWKQELDVWLESDDTKPFVREGLMLGEEEIKKLKIELSTLTNIIPSISSSAVKIIKTN